MHLADPRDQALTNILTRSRQRGHLSNYVFTASVSPICCHLHCHFLACLLSFSRAMDSHLDVAPGVSACNESKTACKYRVYPSLSPQCFTPPLTGSRSAAVICKLLTTLPLTCCCRTYTTTLASTLAPINATRLASCENQAELICFLHFFYQPGPFYHPLGPGSSGRSRGKTWDYVDGRTV